MVAESLLLDLHQAAAADRNSNLLKIFILQAVAYAAQQQRKQALRLAVGPVGAEGYVRLFVDDGEAVRLLIAGVG